MIVPSGAFRHTVKLRPLALPPPKLRKPTAKNHSQLQDNSSQKPTLATDDVNTGSSTAVPIYTTLENYNPYDVASAAYSTAMSSVFVPASTNTSSTNLDAYSNRFPDQSNTAPLVLSNVKLTHGRPTSFIISPGHDNDLDNLDDLDFDIHNSDTQHCVLDHKPQLSDPEQDIQYTDSKSDTTAVSETWPSSNSADSSTLSGTDGTWRDRSSTLVAPPKPPAHCIPDYDYCHVESDTLENELNEFYNYDDFALCANGKYMWETTVLADHIHSDVIQELMEQISMQHSDLRIAASNKLLYFTQGLYLPIKLQSTSDQLQAIIKNNKLLYELDVFPTVYAAFRATSYAFETISKQQVITTETQLTLDLNILEATTYLSIMYSIVLINMRDPAFINEISNLDPYIPQFLFKILAQLAEGNRQHYPVKKLLLLLWKILMTIVGSDADLATMTIEARKLNGIVPADSSLYYIKSTPQDYQNYHTIASHRYPAYYLPDAVHHLSNVTYSMIDSPSENVFQTVSPFYDYTELCPSHEYQLQPLIFKSETTMPNPMLEAVGAFKKYNYVSVGAMQIAREIEVLNQSGLPALNSVENTVYPTARVDGHCPRTYSESRSKKPTPTSGLSRLEKLFSNLQENLPRYMSMLVRLMYYLNLASNESSPKGFGLDEVPSTAQIDAIPLNDRTVVLEWLDSVRHRETVTLAICSSMLLLLRGFKRYHVLAFEYMCQLLMDSNCAILIVKMLNTWFSNIPTNESYSNLGAGSQERPIGSTWLLYRRDPAQLNFIDFCRGPLSPTESATFDTSHSTPDFLNNPHSSKPLMQPSRHRAFSTTICLLRILHKMTKGKLHRILSLVQWKAAIVLKRIVRVNHAGLYLYALKLIKSQIPFLGKKWRPHNLAIVTLIYQHLKPSLIEDYLIGDFEIKTDEALIKEQRLRSLITSFMTRTYAQTKPTSPLSTHVPMHSHPVPTDKMHDQRISNSTTFSHTHHPSVDDLDLILRLSVKGSFDTSNPYHASLLHLSTSMLKSHDHLDDNFMMHYHEWLEKEVYHPMANIIDGELFDATKVCIVDKEDDMPDDIKQHFYYVIEGK
ncbi:hypothetical protein BDV3_003333 [Batrachochytrium dendrobatidis]|nr:hypothetical protein BDEG_21677 [Batrachochytrium dendrobatidis JEL423]